MNPLRLRMRPDLTLESHGRGSERYWIAQDPVTLKYFRLRDEECSILQMLDGRTPLEEIRRRFEQLFAPLRLSVRDLQAYLQRLHELGLVAGDAPGQGTVLKRRADATRWSEWRAAAANPLAIRLPGLRAAPFVNRLYAACRGIFSPAFLIFCAALTAIAGGLAAVELSAVPSRFTDWNALFTVQSAAWFFAALVVVKVLHELGHAVVCRHFGGECRELGVMLLLFAPTLYCDVSDAWRIESRCGRILVSAAGMLVELVLAAVAVLVWRFSEPGMLHEIALRIMLVCSISTLVFNLNPLLRCDGYYILSDLLGVPNLWQESRLLLQQRLFNTFLGTDLPEDPTLPRRLHSTLLIYAILSIAYRWLLVLGILWFCVRLLEPRGLASVAWIFAAVVVGGMVVSPIIRTTKVLRHLSRRRGIRRGRAMTTVLVSAATITALALCPLPHRISAPMWLEPAGAQQVYAPVPGMVRDALPPGNTVHAGDVIARLENPELTFRAAESAREISRLELRLKNLRLSANEDAAAGPQIPTAEKALLHAQEMFAERKRDIERLTLRAPSSGVVLPPPPGRAPAFDAKSLVGRRGTPLDESNRGCLLETGALCCLVGNPANLEATLVVLQADVPFVRSGQRVRLWVEQGPVRVLHGTITALARAEAEDLPGSLARTLDLPTKPHGDELRPIETYYQARVALDPPAPGEHRPLRMGMHGRAKISADWRPPLVRVWRYLQRTFGFA